MRASRSRRWLAVLATTALAAALLVWLWAGAPSQASSGAEQTTTVTPAPTGNPGPPGTPAAPAGPARLATREQQLALWQQRYMRAADVYNNYRDATRYPPESRPLNEHPDRVRPFEPIAEELPLRDASGQPAKGLRLRTSQERVFVAGAESVRFTIEAVDENGRTLPLVIERAVAQSVPDTTALITLSRAPVPFNDSGAAPDDVAGDGRYSALFTPAAQGFADHAGTIRALVEVSANGQKGMVAFDVIYVPEVPATWAGTREALEAGSLNFYLKALVARPGRYVVSGRVFDADGAPLALVQFNGEVAAGAAEFKLPLAGVLVRDKSPKFPLKLVDVEGFLLKPDAFPDRAMLPRQSGTVHVSKSYGIGSFSGDEWMSEERARYLAEYGRDVQQALREIERLGQR